MSGVSRRKNYNRLFRLAGRHPLPNQRTLSLGLFLSSGVLLVRSADAHELTIDQVSLWPDRARAQLRGQVTFDPQLTRQLDPAPSSEEAARRVHRFLERNLKITVDQKPCHTSFEVRELYAEGGAVPGDIVMLTCPLGNAATELRVGLGQGFPALVVTISGFGDPGAETERQSLVLKGGELSPVYHIGAPSQEQWRVGGPDQFLTKPEGTASASAPLAPAASALPPAFATKAKVPPATVPRPPAARGFEGMGWLSSLWRFLWIGFEHILPKGFDHVLFVAGITLGAGQRFKRLAFELSLFTVAHTLTLALGALRWVVVPSHVVEPLIAASIAYVAAENLRGNVKRRQRALVVFAFGLVHGQGFAGVLSQLELPGDAFLPALLGFNLGVEVGQLLVALALSLLLFVLPSRWRSPWVRVPVSLFTLMLASYWVLERVFG